MPQQKKTTTHKHSTGKSEVQTLEITDFGGRLTRVRNGDINSGLAKFDTSWGYNPFFKPGKLSWHYQITDNSSVIPNGIVLASVTQVTGGTVVTQYAITSTGHLYRITAEGSTATLVRLLQTGSPTFTYGADICFYGSNLTLYISHDLGVTKITIDTSGVFVSEAQIGTWDTTHFTPITTRRSMIQFVGNLYVTNSDASVTYANNIAVIDSSLTVTSYAKLSPSLPAGTYIRDLDISPDLTYMVISASLASSELILPGSSRDATNSAAAISAQYKWNGIDLGITTGTNLPAFSITALQSFGTSQMMFMYDAFGSALYQDNTKVLTMRNNKSPMAGATSTTGNFITWMCPEMYWNLDLNLPNDGQFFSSLYYYGSLDEQSPKGLYRMFRNPAGNGNVYQVPYQQFTNNRYLTLNTAASSPTPITLADGTHVFSQLDYNGSNTFRWFSFFVAFTDESPSSSGGAGWSIGAMLGVYETQNQLFSKKISIQEIRVYCENTVTGNGFRLDMIDSNETIVNNGTFNYSYSAGTDITLLQGALSRINFNPNTKDLYSLGLRITNTGSTNMFIDKIEIDYVYSGK